MLAYHELRQNWNVPRLILHLDQNKNITMGIGKKSFGFRQNSDVQMTNFLA